jgi:hypothetical protein
VKNQCQEKNDILIAFFYKEEPACFSFSAKLSAVSFVAGCAKENSGTVFRYLR